MNPLLYLAPLWLAFELWQLVVAERYLGIARIERGMDPRSLPMATGRASFWSLGILAEWLWMVSLLFIYGGRAAGACMLLVTITGFFLRRSTSLRLTLVILTFEGAIRIGMMLFILGVLWHGMPAGANS